MVKKIKLILKFFFLRDTKPCRNMIIAYSGFEGEERARIKVMIELVGAKCTSYLSQQNNLLVCRK